MVTPAAGGDAPGEAVPMALEVKAVREQVAKLWPDTDARLARVEAVLQAQQDREHK